MKTNSYKSPQTVCVLLGGERLMEHGANSNQTGDFDFGAPVRVRKLYV